MLPQPSPGHHDRDGGFGDEVIGEGAEENAVAGLEVSLCGLGLMFLRGGMMDEGGQGGIEKGGNSGFETGGNVPF